MKTKNITYTILVALAIVILSLLIWWLAEKENRPVIEGIVECRTYRASSKLAGRIDSLFVAEGDWIRTGELLYTISTPELDAKLRQVEALEVAAAALNREVERGARKEQIVAVENIWQKALVGQSLAEKSYIRVKNLYEKGVVPRQQYDEALANYEAMKATANSAKAEYELVIEGATREQREAAAAKMREAQAAVAEVNSYLDDARVYAPITGRVSSIIAEPGELVSAGYPVVVILDLSELWATFNIKEDNMAGITIGTQFEAYIPALKQSATFEVYHIAAEADFATWSATRARGGFDIRTFEVRARRVDKDTAILPGMSIVVNSSRL